MWYKKIKKFLSIAGPGYLVAVGYMDPGNWVTGIAAGSKYGYTLLSMVAIASIMAMFLQYAALHLGIYGDIDLAQACKRFYPPIIAIPLWITAEIAMIATDLAEVIGSALALHLLFGISIPIAMSITCIDVLLLLFASDTYHKLLDRVVISMMIVIFICFGLIVWLADPAWDKILIGLVPRITLLTNPDILYLAIGILGATVMPHNLYLHSAITRTRYHAIKKSMNQDSAARYFTADTVIALTGAFFANAALLITAAAVFNVNKLYHIEDIQDAYNLFTPLLGSATASVLFAVALLFSGQNSTLTGTLAGQIVLDGFWKTSISPWLRRFIGRALSVIPAVLAVLYYGDCCLGSFLIASQVVLSLQLPFAIIPLLHFISSKTVCGGNTIPTWLQNLLWGIALLIITLNLYLVISFCI